MKVLTWLAMFLLLFSFTSKGFAQKIDTNKDQGYYRDSQAIGHAHNSIPPRHNGRQGAAIASRAGFHTGITTASIVAGLVVATIVTVAALLLSSSGGSAHSH